MATHFVSIWHTIGLNTIASKIGYELLTTTAIYAQDIVDTVMIQQSPHERTQRKYVEIDPAETEFTQKSIDQRFARSFPDIYNSNVDFDLLEFLSLPSHSRQRYFLGGTIAKVPDRGIDSSQQQLPSIADRDDPATNSRTHGLTKISEILTSRLPEAFDITPVEVDFSPLGISRAATSRVVIRRDENIASVEHVGRTVQSLLTALRNEPHLYQVLIKKQSRTKYKVTIRLALYHPRHQVTSTTEALKIARDGREFYPFDALARSDLSSSFRLMQSQLSGFKSIYGKVRTDPFIDVSSRSMIRRLAKGYPEYDNLITGRMDYHTVYKELDHYPVFIIRERDLLRVLGIPRITYEHDPWAMTERDPVKVMRVDMETTQLENSAAHDTNTDTTVTATASATSARDSPKEGGPVHGWWTKNLDIVLGERGRKVHEVDQTENRSDSDNFVLGPDSNISIYEVAHESNSKPSQILKNVIRAEQWDMDVTFLCVGKKIARKVVDVLTTPFAERDGPRTMLYNASKPVRPETGVTRLLPPEESEADWWIYPDGKVELELCDSIVGHGSARDSTDTFDLDTHIHYVDEGTHVVENPEGEILHRYESKEEFKDDWTRLMKPLVPTRLTYIDYADIKYGTPNKQIHDFTPTANWNTKGKMKRYNGAKSEWFETYTAEWSGASLYRDAMFTRFKQWYRSLTEYKSPTLSVFGRTEVEFATSKTSDDVGKDVYYDDRAYRYPSGIISPDLPDYPATPDIPPEWIEGEPAADAEPNESNSQTEAEDNPSDGRNDVSDTADSTDPEQMDENGDSER